MNLQKKVFITAVSFVLVSIIFAFISFYIVSEVKETTTELNSAVAMAVKSVSLDHLFINYYIDRSEKTRQAWLKNYQELGRIIMTVKFDQQEEQDLLKRAAASYSRTGTLYQAFFLSKDKAHALAVVEESRNIIVSAFKLRQSNARYMITLHKNSMGFVTLAIVLVVAILAGNLLLIIFRIVRPVIELSKGVELVGSGDLDYRAGNLANDEIGNLARAFDVMTVNLQKTALRYRTILKSVVDGFCIIDVEGRFLEVSKSLCLMTGYAEQELLTMELSDLEAGQERTSLRACFKDVLVGDPVCYELQYQRKDGTVVDFETSVQNLQDEEKLVIFFHDITVRKKNERELSDYRLHLEAMVKERTQALEAANKELVRLSQVKSDFVSMVSHELRTPLTPIREAMSLMHDGIAGEITEKQRHFLDIGLRNIDRLARLINDLLDISRIEAGRLDLVFEPFDIAEVVKGVAATFALLADKKGLTLKAGECVSAFLVHGDKDKTAEVFSNLVGNAVKFTDKGSITLCVKEKPGFVECSIEDTGRGISPHNLELLFRKFEQFNRSAGDGEKGTGLGLSISKGIVEAQGGKIWAQSVLDKGSVFFFTIPLYNKEEAKKEVE
jgi:PAS domain S-box-containing protein